MEGNKKRRKRTMLIIILSIVICAGLLILGLSLYGKYRMGKIPSLSFREALEYTTKNNAYAIITVGIIKDGQTSYTVYGENGKELLKELHTYEIGSLTKTFTATLIAKAIREGKIDINAIIDQYLDLPNGNTYPSIEELLTHTSGYEAYYFESPMVFNFFKGRNDFYGITKNMLINKIGKINVPSANYKLRYSNFGYAVLGLVLEKVYESDYTSLMNEFVQNELNLSDTKISEQNVDLGNYWDWNSDDAYLPAGAVTSNINDMLAYAQMQLDEYEYFADCHKGLKEIYASTEQYKLMGINMDEISMAWLTDKENSITWHNGGTGDYNCYLGFNSQTDVAVIVLSNLSPSYKIPATVLGLKAFMELEQ